MVQQFVDYMDQERRLGDDAEANRRRDRNGAEARHKAEAQIKRALPL